VVALSRFDEPSRRYYGKTSESETGGMNSFENRRFGVIAGWIVAGGLLAAAIIVPFLLFGEQLEQLSEDLLRGGNGAHWAAWLGVVLLVLDVYLPIPSSIVMTVMGALAGPWAGWGLSCLGLTIGAAVGYATGLLIGPFAIRVLVGHHQGRILSEWMSRNGYWVIAACRAVPVLAEGSLIVAGTARMPSGKTMLTATAANALVPIPYVMLGSAASGSDRMFYVAFGLSLALSGFLWYLGRASSRNS